MYRLFQQVYKYQVALPLLGLPVRCFVHRPTPKVSPRRQREARGNLEKTSRRVPGFHLRPVGLQEVRDTLKADEEPHKCSTKGRLCRRGQPIHG